MDGSVTAATPEHRVSDRTLRGIAWALGVLIVVSFVVQGTFAYLNRNAKTAQTSWSTDGLLGALSAAGLLLFVVVGFILARRVPRNWIGWIMLLVGLSIAVPFDGYAQYALLVRHGELPGGRLLEAIAGPFWVPLIMLSGVFLVLLFPDGHVPPGWRWFAWSAGAVMAIAMLVVLTGPGPFESLPKFRNPLGISWTEPLQSLILLIPLAIVGAAISLIQRYRRSSGTERLQLKWLAAAVSIVAVTYLIVEPVSAAVGFNEQRTWLSVLQAFALFTFGLIPVAIGVAILKYRLYEIDVVINRAVLFGSMAVFITVAYVGLVAAVGALAGSGGSPVVSAVAAAIVAIAFQPARRRAQRFADRLVYGARATPYEVLSSFSERLAGAYSDEDLLPRMARILGEGTGAERADVWLRSADELRPVAVWPTDAELRPPVSTATGDGLVPVRHQGELLGALSIEKRAGEQISPTEQKLIADLAAQAGLVLRNASLIDDLRRSRHRLVTAQDEERRKIERNLHDGAQQQLVALAVRLKLARSLVERDPAKAGAILDGLQGSATEALEDLRDLARGIYPPLLADKGLAAALEAQARKAAVPVVVEVDGVGRYPQEIEGTVYFCSLEALNNIAKYANASSAAIRLTQTDGNLGFEVVDDGGGFDPERTGYGTGLQGMADRLSALGGSLDVRSTPGAGTTVAGTLPIGGQR